MATPPSAHFHYHAGQLQVDAVPLRAVAERFDTPCYVYSASAIDKAYARIDASLRAVPHLVAYAVKANGNLAILKRLARAGSGADIVSGGELVRALRAGFPAERIVFSGVGKRSDELSSALQAGVRALHAESEQEVDAIEAVAGDLGVRAPVALRVNPEVDANTHPYIATGLSSSKFGVTMERARELLPRLLQSQHLSLEGIACHIGSMVSSPEPIAEAVEIAARFAVECARAGAPLKALDAGGGWPIDYGDETQQAAPYCAFGAQVVSAFERGGARELGLSLMIEPGRAVVGDAGVLLTRVLYVKSQGDKRFVIVDAAMSELVRPALYQAYHAVMPVDEQRLHGAHSPADLVGPICESGDFLARARPLPELSPGDLLAIRGAGAYAASMASNYNTRPFAAEVLIDSGEAKLVRRRQSIEALLQDEVDAE